MVYPPSLWLMSMMVKMMVVGLWLRGPDLTVKPELLQVVPVNRNANDPLRVLWSIEFVGSREDSFRATDFFHCLLCTNPSSAHRHVGTSTHNFLEVLDTNTQNFHFTVYNSKEVQTIAAKSNDSRKESSIHHSIVVQTVGVNGVPYAKSLDRICSTPCGRYAKQACQSSVRRDCTNCICCSRNISKW